MQFKTCGKLRARDADLLWACKRELHKRQFGALLHPPGHLSRHRQVETPSVAQRKAWLEDERHPGLVNLTRTDFRDLKSSQGQQGQPGQPRLDWDVFFPKATRRTLLAQAFPVPAQHVGRCWELHSYDRTPRPLPRGAKNRSFYDFSDAPYPPLYIIFFLPTNIKDSS